MWDFGSNYNREGRELANLRNRVRRRVSDLQEIIDKLDLYDVAADAPDPGPPLGPPLAGPRTAHVTVNVHGPVGTLNTGEVLGSIYSHVESITGSWSAGAFRDSMKSLAAEIADNQELPEQARRETLEAVDGLAEELGREPSKRRVGIIRGMLLAIPAGLQVSTRAMEAWDTYGPVIQAHIDHLLKH